MPKRWSLQNEIKFAKKYLQKESFSLKYILLLCILLTGVIIFFLPLLSVIKVAFFPNPNLLKNIAIITLSFSVFTLRMIFIALGLKEYREDKPLLKKYFQLFIYIFCFSLLILILPL